MPTNNRLRFLLAACVLGALILLLLNGCAADPVGWKEEPTHNALPVVFRVSTIEQIQRCTGLRNTIGCASRDYARGFCYVLVPADAPLWLLSHEMLHCAGYDHGL